MTVLRLVLLASIGAACCAQTAPFRIQIPNVGAGPLDSDRVEAHGDRPDVIFLHVLNPLAADVAYDKISTKLNGASANFIQTVTSGAEGKIVRMDLKLRAGMLLGPGVNTVEITAVNRRGRKYYRNFLVHTREENRNDYFAYETRTDSAGVEKDLPPEIVLSQPDLPITLSSRETRRSVRVAGVVSASHPLGKLVIHGKNSDPITQSGAFDRQVEVSAKDSGISVEAVDQRGNRTVVVIPVTQIAEPKKTNLGGERYALIIGISEYGGAKAPSPLPSAAADALSFSDSLRSKLGFRSENILFLKDSAATRERLSDTLRTFAARPKPDDLLIVYFAGYGLHDPLNPEKIYLAAHDTQLGRFAETALSLDELKSTINSSVRARQSILLFDVGRAVQGEWATGNNNLVNDYLVRLFAGDPAKAVMVASNVNEVSAERGGPGLFTQQLIEAALGKADANGDGVVTAREWFLWVSRGVKGASGGAQNPRFTPIGPEKALFAVSR
ncbi:MAG TPA: caspase family protein [Gemmataceae bacterium]|nr:caspase family protein [Gemmataceae bacterium]